MWAICSILEDLEADVRHSCGPPCAWTWPRTAKVRPALLGWHRGSGGVAEDGMGQGVGRNGAEEEVGNGWAHGWPSPGKGVETGSDSLGWIISFVPYLGSSDWPLGVVPPILVVPFQIAPFRLLHITWGKGNKFPFLWVAWQQLHVLGWTWSRRVGLPIPARGLNCSLKKLPNILSCSEVYILGRIQRCACVLRKCFCTGMCDAFFHPMVVL